MVYAMVGRSEDDLLQETHPAVAHDVFSYVDKRAPCSVDGHDEEEQWWVYTCHDANGGADHICIGGFKEEMHIGDGEVHALWCVVGGMEAPEQTYLMTEIMIDEVGKLPDDVSINKPVPCEGRVEGRIFFQEADAKSNGCDGDEAGDEPVGNKYKEGHPVIFYPESFIHQGAYDLDEEEKGDHRRDGGQKTMRCRQRGIISFVIHVKQGVQAGEADELVV